MTTLPRSSLSAPAGPLTRVRARVAGDLVLYTMVTVCAVLVLVLLAGIFWEVYEGSRLSMSVFGWKFLASSNWDPAANVSIDPKTLPKAFQSLSGDDLAGDFGALSSVYGTLVSTAIAMLIAVPMSLVIALFLTELAPAWLATIVGGAIELLAAIPSIIYGMWGFFVLAPLMATYVQPPLQKWTGHLPLFSGPPMGLGMLTAGLILALMILPFITVVTRDIFRMTPAVLRESAYGIGSTTWEVTRNVSMPYGLRGIVGATFLGLGRALGETMAVTFVIGNNHDLSGSLYALGNTISSTLANEFAEAPSELYSSALIELGLVLLVITVISQVMAQVWLKWAQRGLAGAR